MENSIIHQRTAGTLDVRVYASRKAMGDAAGRDIAEAMRTLLAEKDEINMIFAAAPSQNETLAALVAEPVVVDPDRRLSPEIPVDCINASGRTKASTTYT